MNERQLSTPLVPIHSTRAQTPKKLSYLEAREYADIERHITGAELVLQSKRAQLEDLSIASNAPRLVAAQAEVEAAQKPLDALYARWAELEERGTGFSV